MGLPQHELDALLLNRVNIGDLDGVKDFIANGANISNADEGGWTLLMVAVEGNRTDIVKYLLELGVDVNERGDYDRTALMTAAMGNNTEITRILLEAGADLSLVDNNGESALKMAEENRKFAVIDLLKGDYQKSYQEQKKLSEKINTPESAETLKF